jgi:A/G-specific adenine glycosylase
MTSRRKLTLENSQGRERLRKRLLAWYDRHQRDLPWRRDRDPYRVWLSEIMLQQTRVATVVDYYQSFLRRFPTVGKLAAARETSILAAWSGLGYYRRARMLHAAAKRIVKEHAGRFPANAERLRTLPGIGRYTAAAIASIAFGEPVAVVDGNVERILRRLLGENLAGESLWQTAEELLSRRRPGDFNQAMMELGATLCLPRQPMCLTCPVFELCATRGELEEAAKKAPQKKREIHYALDRRDGSVWLVKRPDQESLMPGMWELPEIPRKNSNGEAWLTLRHSITVTDYVVRVRQGPASKQVSGKWVAKSRLTALPLTGLTQKILRAAAVI